MIHDLLLLSLLVLFILKAALDHAWFLAHTRCVPRILTPKSIFTWAEPHNSITLTQWPFYGLLLLAGVNAFAIVATAMLSYSFLFQPIINAAQGHPYFYEGETRSWPLLGRRVPKFFYGRRRIFFLFVAPALYLFAYG